MIKKKPAQEFLVVWEDEWNNKESYRTTKIGTTIQKIADDNELQIEYDKEKLNSADPYSAGTFGPGFYDIDCYKPEEGQDEPEYAGRIMIFQL